jgi:hypothetical protein
LAGAAAMTRMINFPLGFSPPFITRTSFGNGTRRRLSGEIGSAREQATIKKSAATENAVALT